MLKKAYTYVVNPSLTVLKVCDSATEVNSGNYLPIKTAHKMIKQFLFEKKMPRDELAEKLGLTLEEFEQFNSVYGYKKFAPVASYKLLCLYCRTKWNSDKQF